MTKLNTIIITLLIATTSAVAQNSYTEKGSQWTDFLLNFSSSKVTFDDDGHGHGADSTSNQFLGGVSYNWFIADNLFVGGSLGGSSISEKGGSISNFFVGPSLGYAIHLDTVIPFASVGYHYITGSNELSGHDIPFSLGLGVPISSNVAVNFNARYTLGSRDHLTQNVFSTGIGFIIKTK